MIVEPQKELTEAEIAAVTGGSSLSEDREHRNTCGAADTAAAVQKNVLDPYYPYNKATISPNAKDST